MLAREVMSDGVLSIQSDATVLQAAELLLNTRVSAMPVVDEKNTMVGIVSLADLIGSTVGSARDANLGSLRQLADDAAASAAYNAAVTRNVVDVMSKDVAVVAETDTLLDVAEVMQARRVKRVPVVRDGAVVGIISRVDLLKALISFAASHSPERPSSTTTDTSDERLREAVVAALGAAPGLAIQRADVVVRDGVTHLWGVVASDLTRRTCDSVVQKVPGVKRVMDHMHVAGGSRAGRR
jgi:CBS-domain-containing membrane protein